MKEEKTIVTPICYCSFCGRSDRESRILLAGPGPSAFICETCTIDAVHAIRETKIPDFLTDEVIFKAGFRAGVRAHVKHQLNAAIDFRSQHEIWGE